MENKSGLECSFGVAITESEFTMNPEFNKQLNIKIGFYVYQVPRLSNEQLTIIKNEIDKILKKEQSKNNMESDNSVFVLCNNYRASTWRAVAVWNHKPTKEDILKVGLFKENPNRNIELELSKRIAENGLCRLNFINSDSEKRYDNWIEYILIQPDENGDLNLDDLLLTGCCDSMSDEYNIYSDDFKEE